MSTDAHDLTEYRRQVIEHGLFGRARARLFEDVWEGKPWTVDLTTGFLKIGEQTFRAEILGTYVAEDNTFLWAWANPGASCWEKSLAAVKQLRSLAAAPENPAFREETFSGDWVDPMQLAYVSGELAGGLPVYPADTGSATILFLVKGAAQDPTELPPVYVPGVLLDFQALAKTDMRLCTDRFLERLGFSRPGPAGTPTYARADGATLSVEWDAADRITTVKLST